MTLIRLTGALVAGLVLSGCQSDNGTAAGNETTASAPAGDASSPAASTATPPSATTPPSPHNRTNVLPKPQASNMPTPPSLPDDTADTTAPPR